MAEPNASPMDSFNSSSTSEYTSQGRLESAYAQLTISVDQMNKNLMKDEEVYDKSFSEKIMKTLKDETAVSIEPLLKLQQVEKQQEERLEVFQTYRSAVENICNQAARREHEESDAKVTSVFSNREELLEHIVCKLQTIKTKDKKLSFSFD